MIDNPHPVAVWRARFGIKRRVAAAVLGISPELLERIEAGEVEPAPELALRIYIVAGGDVPLSTWPRVAEQLRQGELLPRALVARHPEGGHGVGLFLGAELVRCLRPGEALDYAAEIRDAAALAAVPPRPLPVVPWEHSPEQVPA